MNSNRIYDKRCIIKNRRGESFCTKCGRKLVDEYAVKKHGEVCNFSKYDFSSEEIFEEDKDVAYSTQVRYDQVKDTKWLIFKIYLPKLFPAGHKDSWKEHRGGWKPIYYIAFSNHGEIVEEGVKNFEYWMHRMRKNRSLNSKEYTALDAIHLWNPSIISMYSLGMFYHIFKNRGYRNNDPGYVQKVKKHLEEHVSVAKQEAKKRNLTHYSQEKRRVDAAGQIIRLPGIDKSFFLFDLFLYKPGMCTYDGSIYISDDFCYSNMIFKEYSPDVVSCQVSDETALRFHEEHPSFCLNNYIHNKGNNVLLCLLSGSYNSALELTAKAGLTCIADNFFIYVNLTDFNPYQVDPVKLLGMPVKLLKRYNRMLTAYRRPELWVKLKKIYQLDPSYLYDTEDPGNMLAFFFNGMRFYDLDNYYEPMDLPISFMRTWDKKQILKIIRYLNKIEREERRYLPFQLYGFYRDYLHMCAEMKEDGYQYNYTPKNLIKAHDDLVKEYNERNAAKQEFIQSKVLYNEKYLMLASDYMVEEEEENQEEEKQEEKNPLLNAPYKILVPVSYDEIRKEGKALHHCVGTYVDSVIQGNCYILFLRKSNNLEKPYATIEVSRDKRLIQVKASCNTPVNRSAARFVKKYCNYKNIRYESCFDLVRAENNIA